MESISILQSSLPFEGRKLDVKQETKPTVVIEVEDAPQENSVLRAFANGQKDWSVDPVMATWRQPTHRIANTLAQVEALHTSWSNNKPGPFSLYSDPLWTSTVDEMRKAGLPLHNNNINLPEDIDEGWPFHFKEAERLAVISKGARVGSPDPAGYVCHWNEANHYCIRALQQELRREHPTHRPILVACKFEVTILQHISRLLGLELEIWATGWAQTSFQPRSDSRPLIFAATFCNNEGESDDFKAIRRLSKTNPVWVHVDAARNFDYVTTLSPLSQAKLRIPKLTLEHSKLGFQSSEKGRINASTIVAGGMTGFTPTPVVALKPRALGNLEDRRIAYIKASDSTISGSRDSLDPLLLGMQEQRFSKGGLQKIYRRCFKNRQSIYRVLKRGGVVAQCPSMSLDIIIHSSRRVDDSIQRRLGISRLSSGAFIATIQPSLQLNDARFLVDTFLGRNNVVPSSFQVLTTNVSEFPIPLEITLQLRTKVSHWRMRTKDSAGYPFNQGPYTALGPVIGHFLDKAIPMEWVSRQAEGILTQRKRMFGLNGPALSSFGATFTTGSTMGNQIGVHAAVESFPYNFIYVSSAAHYSVTKALMDSDILAARWEPVPTARFAVIPIDETGRMDRNALAERVILDRKSCLDRGQKYGVTLFVTLGTTFTGAKDDIIDLQRALQSIGQTVSYIHIDGALDFGFSNCGIRLDNPSTLAQHFENGIVAAQGITLSHHKAYGMMVSGEVICFDPSGSYIPTTCSLPCSRAVFEVWLFQKMYQVGDLEILKEYSLETAVHLHTRLKASEIFTRLNEGTTIVVVERPPLWIVEDYGLRCEGDWAHYITMPHINREATERFVDAMSQPDRHLAKAAQQVQHDAEIIFGRGAHCRRVRPLDQNFAEIMCLAADKKTRLHPKSVAITCDVATLKQRYIDTALCITIFDSNDSPAALFLVHSEGPRSFSAGAVLIRDSFQEMELRIVDVGKRLFKRYFELLEVQFQLL